MITVTLTLNGEQVDKHLPEHWGEVSWAMFVELAKFEERTQENMLCYLLGIEEELLPLFPEEVLLQYYHHLSFLLDFSSIPAKDKPISISIKASSWQKLESAKRILSANHNHFLPSAAAVIAAYTKRS